MSTLRVVGNDWLRKKFDDATIENIPKIGKLNAQFVDLFSYVCPQGKCREQQDGVTLRPDGVHYTGAGANIVARWLIDQARQSS